MVPGWYQTRARPPRLGTQGVEEFIFLMSRPLPAHREVTDRIYICGVNRKIMEYLRELAVKIERILP
jgi:hypothetical protein